MSRTLVVIVCTLLGVAPLTLARAEPADLSTDDTLLEYERRIEQLESELGRLRSELEELKAGKSEPMQEAEESTEPDIYQPQEIQPTGREKLLPDISVIVDTVGRVSTSAEVEPDRNDARLRGLELVVQGYLYPQIRGDVVLAAEGDEPTVSVHEAYASILQIGESDLSAVVGRKFLDIGKNNPVHRERWPYVTQPFAVRNLLSADEGLSGEGAQLNCLLPGRANTFCQLSLGMWKPAAHHHVHEGEDEEEHHHHLGLGISGKLHTGRVWLSRAIGESAELELGTSAAFGTGEDEDGDRISLLGVDLTYKAWGDANRRLILQAEGLRHKRDTKGADDPRYGYYLLGLHRTDAYNEFGLRYDWAQRPSPAVGNDSGLSAFYTRMLSETSYARAQVTFGNSADAGRFTAAYLQFVWGLGPHAHDLQ